MIICASPELRVLAAIARQPRGITECECQDLFADVPDLNVPRLVGTMARTGLLRAHSQAVLLRRPWQARWKMTRLGRTRLGTLRRANRSSLNYRATSGPAGELHRL